MTQGRGFPASSPRAALRNQTGVLNSASSFLTNANGHIAEGNPAIPAVPHQLSLSNQLLPAQLNSEQRKQRAEEQSQWLRAHRSSTAIHSASPAQSSSRPCRTLLLCCSCSTASRAALLESKKAFCFAEHPPSLENFRLYWITGSERRGNAK